MTRPTQQKSLNPSFTFELILTLTGAALLLTATAALLFTPSVVLPLLVGMVGIVGFFSGGTAMIKAATENSLGIQPIR